MYSRPRHPLKLRAGICKILLRSVWAMLAHADATQAVCQSCYGIRRPPILVEREDCRAAAEHATALHMQQPCTCNSPARATALHVNVAGPYHDDTRLEVL
eukprot:366328-Chlamydomonas_euryale.AAC.15